MTCVRVCLLQQPNLNKYILTTPKKGWYSICYLKMTLAPSPHRKKNSTNDQATVIYF